MQWIIELAIFIDLVVCGILTIINVYGHTSIDKIENIHKLKILQNAQQINHSITFTNLISQQIIKNTK